MVQVAVSGPSYEVTAPDVPVMRGGLLDVATIVDEPDAHARSGVRYVTVNCHPAGLAPGQCCEAVTTDDAKVYANPEETCGEPFTVYKGIGCDILGEPYDQLAQDALTRGESVPVENAFYQLFLAGAPQLTTDAVCPKVALGLLEQYAGANYTGVPVIHTTRLGATVLAAEDLAVPGIDMMLSTPLGSPVVAAAGWTAGPDGTEPATGDFWMYATGHVVAHRSPIEVFAGRDTDTNESLAIAERAWSITAECFVVAVPVHVEC
jgi:hypothetical protein